MNESYYRLFFENSPDGMLLTQPDGEIVAANGAICRLLGYRQEELLTLNKKDLIDPASQGTINLMKPPLQLETTSSELVLVARNGSKILCEISAQLFEDKEGQQKISLIIRDLRVRRQKEEAERNQHKYAKALHKTALALLNRQELDDLLQTILTQAVELINTSYGFVYLVEPGANVLSLKVGIGQAHKYLNMPIQSGQGLAGKVWQSGQAMIINDYAHWSGRITSFEGKPPQSIMGVPLKIGPKVIGVLGLGYVEPGQAFDETALELLSQFAQLASIALDNTQLYSAAQRRLSELAMVQRVARVINSTLQLKEVFETVVHEISEAFGYRMVSVYLLSETGLALQASIGYEEARWFIGLDQGVTGRAARTGQALFIRDAGSEADFIMIKPDTRQAIAVPLKSANEEVLGVLVVESTDYPQLTEDDLALLMLLADQVSVAVENARLFVKLSRSEDKYRSVVAALTDGILLTDQEGIILATNASAERIMGLSTAQMIGRDMDDALWQPIHEDGRPFAAADRPIMTTLREGQPQSNVVMGMPRPDGTFRWLSINTQPLFKPGEDRPYAAVSSFQDITERRLAEDALLAEKERLAVTLRAIGDGVITTDTDGKVVLINAVAEELTGWRQQEAIGQKVAQVFQIFEEDSLEKWENLVETVLQTGQSIELIGSAVLLARSGEERLISNSAAPIHNQEGRLIGVVLVFRDVTKERKLAEEWLKESKIEALGLLAGGIAHDFNNLLTAILGNFSLAKMEVDPREAIYSCLEDGEKAALQAKELTGQLLTFAKGGMPVKKTARLSEVISDSVKFAQHGSNVQCEVNLAPDLLPVEVDSGQLSQVIQNLVLNAVQAMPEGGTIVVEAKNLVLGLNEELPLPKGQYVQISVKDQGTGIATEHVAKVFDPYFTTKPHGNGLGLAVAYSVIKRHEGHLAVESKVGLGTTFHIYLPASHKRLAQSEKPVPPPMVATQQGRVLVMDDEPSIQVLLTRLLGRLGYEVKLAQDGHEAIQHYRAASQANTPFDVVIMDLTIPGGMGGKEAVKELLTLDERARVIVSSGYSSDPVMANYREYGFKAVIAKPYRLEELTSTIKQVMSGVGD